MTAESHLHSISGLFWRSSFVGREHHLLDPAGAPMGRWHHNGQTALYLSETPDGCRVATRIYHSPEDPPRFIYPFRVENALVVDLRAAQVRSAFDVSLKDIHVFWRDLHADGQSSPTWALGDQIRSIGATGLLTPSRSRPDLTHLTLFEWNSDHGPSIERSGNPVAH